MQPENIIQPKNNLAEPAPVITPSPIQNLSSIPPDQTPIEPVQYSPQFIEPSPASNQPTSSSSPDKFAIPVTNPTAFSLPLNPPEDLSQQPGFVPMPAGSNIGSNPGRKPRAKMKWIIVGGILVIVGGLVAYTSIANHSNTPVVTSKSNKPYIAIKDNFKINFLSTPTSQSSTSTISQASVPVTSYSTNNGNEEELVAVYNLPNTLSSELTSNTVQQSFLHQWVNGTAGVRSDGLTISVVSSSFITFRDYDTAYTHYSFSANGTTEDEYQYLFLKGSIVYNITTIDYPISIFNTFVDSFQLTD
jgi:hypothetical protein